MKLKWQLDLKKLCGQAYDGTGAMSGKSWGVAARIMEQYPRALYTHCSSHGLNLCIVKSTSISDVRNMMDIADKVARFFNYSPKRLLALEWHINQLHQEQAEVSKRKKLKELCKIRWVERHDAFEAFFELFNAILSCLEEMARSTLADWNRETISDAQSYVHSLTDFKYIVTLTISKSILSYTKGLGVKLQGKW